MSAAPSRPGVCLLNLGCRVNRVELDLMATELEAAGAALVCEEEADAIVVNTCAVTGEAEAKTRKAIRHAAGLPKAPAVVATGCVASLFSPELEALAPNVRVEADKSRVAAEVLAALGIPAGSVTDEGELAPMPTPTGRCRPGVKIQDGCDNRCTYCIVWKARGAGRSMEPAEVLSRVRAAQARGAHEVVLTGINLGSYRWEDGGQNLRLPQLLDLILGQTDVERVRLSSIEPPDVTTELCDVMAQAGERVAPFLHVCLQSGCDETLRRMARVYRRDLFRRVVDTARSRVDRLALGTDLIVGFPGETDVDFEDSLSFCEQMRFAKMHVFRYSRRPGTPASAFPDQVDPRVMAERAACMRGLAARMRQQEAARLVGTDDLALVQYPGRAVTGGLFDVLVDKDVAVDTLLPVRLASVDDKGTLTGVAR